MDIITIRTMIETHALTIMTLMILITSFILGGQAVQLAGLRWKDRNFCLLVGLVGFLTSTVCFGILLAIIIIPR